MQLFCVCGRDRISIHYLVSSLSACFKNGMARFAFPLVFVENRLRRGQPHVNRVRAMREGGNGQASSLPATMKSMGWMVPMDSATRI